VWLGEKSPNPTRKKSQKMNHSGEIEKSQQRRGKTGASEKTKKKDWGGSRTKRKAKAPIKKKSWMERKTREKGRIRWGEYLGSNDAYGGGRKGRRSNVSNPHLNSERDVRGKKISTRNQKHTETEREGKKRRGHFLLRDNVGGNKHGRPKDYRK